MGDSGPQLDTFDNGQSPDSLHGSIIRIDVSSVMFSGYSIPSGNPFSGGGERGGGGGLVETEQATVREEGFAFCKRTTTAETGKRGTRHQST